jgi:hypothetical protein
MSVDEDESSPPSTERSNVPQFQADMEHSTLPVPESVPVAVDEAKPTPKGDDSLDSQADTHTLTNTPTPTNTPSTTTFATPAPRTPSTRSTNNSPTAADENHHPEQTIEDQNVSDTSAIPFASEPEEPLMLATAQHSTEKLNELDSAPLALQPTSNDSPVGTHDVAIKVETNNEATTEVSTIVEQPQEAQAQEHDQTEPVQLEQSTERPMPEAAVESEVNEPEAFPSTTASPEVTTEDVVTTEVTVVTNEATEVTTETHTNPTPTLASGVESTIQQDQPEAARADEVRDSHIPSVVNSASTVDTSHHDIPTTEAAALASKGAHVEDEEADYEVIKIQPSSLLIVNKDFLEMDTQPAEEPLFASQGTEIKAAVEPTTTSEEPSIIHVEAKQDINQAKHDDSVEESKAAAVLVAETATTALEVPFVATVEETDVLDAPPLTEIVDEAPSQAQVSDNSQQILANPETQHADDELVEVSLNDQAPIQTGTPDKGLTHSTNIPSLDQAIPLLVAQFTPSTLFMHSHPIAESSSQLTKISTPDLLASPASSEPAESTPSPVEQDQQPPVADESPKPSSPKREQSPVAEKATVEPSIDASLVAVAAAENALEANSEAPAPVSVAEPMEQRKEVEETKPEPFPESTNVPVASTTEVKQPEQTTPAPDARMEISIPEFYTVTDGSYTAYLITSQVRIQTPPPPTFSTAMNKYYLLV